jgi:hypothetical protein
MQDKDANEQLQQDEHHALAYPISPANPAQMMAAFNAFALLTTHPRLFGKPPIFGSQACTRGRKSLAMSAIPRFADSSRTSRQVREGPTCDMAAIDKVQRIASPSDCAAAALCFRGELVLPIS